MGLCRLWGVCLILLLGFTAKAQAETIWLQNPKGFQAISPGGVLGVSFHPNAFFERAKISPLFPPLQIEPSPNYRHWAFVARNQRLADPTPQVYFASPDREYPEIMTSFHDRPKSVIGMPRWSPDGKFVIFWRYPSPKSSPELWLLELSALSEPVLLFRLSSDVSVDKSYLGMEGLLWAPDNQSILIQTQGNQNALGRLQQISLTERERTIKDKYIMFDILLSNAHFFWMRGLNKLVFVGTNKAILMSMQNPQKEQRVAWPKPWFPVPTRQKSYNPSIQISPNAHTVLLTQKVPDTDPRKPYLQKGLAYFVLNTGRFQIIDKNILLPQMAQWIGSSKVITGDYSPQQRLKGVALFDLKTRQDQRMPLPLVKILDFEPSPDLRRVAILGQTSKQTQLCLLQLQPWRIENCVVVPRENLALRAWVP